MFEVPLDINPSELDGDYKHLNHADILRYLEKARLLYLESKGCPNQSFIDKNLFLVIANIEVSYKREVTTGVYQFTVDKVNTEGKILWMHQRVINSKGKDCVVAKYDFRIIDGATRLSVSLPDSLSILCV